MVKVDDGFYAFARENGWEQVDSTLGRSLWDFVAGHELVKLQRMLLRRIRGGLGNIELPFRCDGPDVRRRMEIQIAARSSGRFVLFSSWLKEEERREEFQPLLAAETPRGEETLTMCGWCDRFLVDGDWVEVEEAVKRLALFDRTEMPAISHGVCPECTELLLAA